jgi:hypothetical protein
MLLTAMLLHTFSGWLVVADYYVNTNSYAKNCENKARPKMRCNGKCQMMKKIAAVEKEEKEKPEEKSNNKSEWQLLYTIISMLSLQHYSSCTLSTFIFPISSGAISHYSFAPFHPPKYC